MALPEAYFRASVFGVEDLHARLRRVVLGGDGLTGYASCGAPDEWLRILVPPGRQREVELPRRVGSHWEFASPQPLPRWYSARRFDAERHALTVDVVRHGDGPAVRWVEEVEVGDQVLVSQPHGRLGRVPGDWLLVVADQTGLPAATRILEELPAGHRVHAILEAPDEAATSRPATAAALTLEWMLNPEPERAASPLAAAARAVALPPGAGFVWMAGEASCARDVRRYVRHELRWRSSAYDIVGYWRPDAEGYAQRYRRVEDEVGRIYDRGRAAGRGSEEILDDVFGAMEQHGL